ncbi:MAG: hypothetical protein KAT74_03995 [Candidatus Cloacimonetes bacterium]|nr:hypothetical protein [Candidatus Cloacimonadota bacterium]
MKKLILVYFIIVSGLVFANGIAIEGALILQDNTTIPIEGFTRHNNLDDYFFSCTYENKTITILLSQIERVDIISGTITYKNNSNKVIIKLKNGKEYNVLNINFSGIDRGWLYYTIFDIINEKVVNNHISSPELKSFIFYKVGDVTIDSQSGAKFPPDYRYNPYTGNILEPGNFEE